MKSGRAIIVLSGWMVAAALSTWMMRASGAGPTTRAETGAASPTAATQVAAAAPGAADEALAASFHATVQPLLEKYCYRCHSDAGGTQKASVAFDEYKTVADARADIETWKLVLEDVRRGDMPPASAKAKPTADERRTLAEWVDVGLLGHKPNDPGRVTVHRLNRNEYNNTVRDLLGVDYHPADDFPPDDSGYGFDNIGDVLSMSPTLLEKYLKAADKISRRALFGVENLQPQTITHEPWYIDFDTVRVVKQKGEYDETGMSMPYSVHVIQRFPVEADYELKGMTRGFRPIGSDPIRLGFWVDGKMIGEGKVPVPPGPVPAGGEMNGLYATVRAHIPAGEHWLAVSILYNYEGLPPAYHGPNPSKSTVGITKVPTENFINNLIVTGPFDQVKGPSPESVAKIFTAPRNGRSDADYAREVLANLAHRAYRRPVTKEEVEKLAGVVAMVQKTGDSFEEGLCAAIQAILISPHFLYRLEMDRSGDAVAADGSRALNANELATRLSYFLWSSMPDDALLAAADDGSLLKPDVLEAQTRRMIKDPKSRQLTENFGGQWLQFRGLDFHTVERKKFQQYTDYTIMSMKQETELFFDAILRDDKSVLDFIDADYSYLNQRLAEFYGIPGVKGLEFRKVTLPADAHRGGVITQASVLTVSSYPTRTSPVIRGKWILENLLNAPPPDPPPNVPSLKTDAVGKTASIRQQLEAHRENPACAACHERMDPLGFGLDNFDAVGAYRTMDGQVAIDSSGVLPDGRSFKGAGELKAILLAQKESFAECLTDKMLTYALGRGLTLADHTTVQSIAGDVEKNDYRMSSVILGIVKSAPFQRRSVVSSNSTSGSAPGAVQKN